MKPDWFGVAAVLMWSSTAFLLAIAGNIPPLQLTSMSWGIGFIVLGGYYLVRREKIITHFNRPVSDYLFVGFGICVYTALLYCAFYYAPPFEANALNYLWPIF